MNATTETEGILLKTADRLFADQCTRGVVDDAESGGWPQELWNQLEASGLTLAATSEARGGPGAELRDMYVLIKAVGAHGAPIPLVETLLAEQLLAAAGLPTLQGPATVGPVLRGNTLAVRRSGGKWKLSGLAHRVPWARHAAAMVIVVEHDGKTMTAVIEHPSVETRGANSAQEPRDTVRFDEFALADGAVGEPGAGLTQEDLYLRGALCRTLAMTGALEKALALTVGYAKERVQFGRPIGKFQAVQQQVALMASHVAASSAVAQAAIAASSCGAAAFEIAAAKIRVSEAAGVVAAIAHQVHGAIGFTHEHELHRSTRRLWAWRDEFGSDTEWATWLGQTAAAMGGEALWPFMTARREAPAAG